MTRAARLWLDTPLEPPLYGSMGIMGHYFHRILGELGYDVECSIVPDQPAALQMIPIPAAASTASMRSLRREEIRIFFDRCLSQVLPVQARGVKNVVFFHGLRYAPSVFLKSEAIAGFCTNSDYLKRVLLGLLRFPDLDPDTGFRSVRQLAFRGNVIVDAVPLVLPATEFPDGYPSYGEDLPGWLEEELERDQWLGHALRPRKLIAGATAAIVHLLNQEPLRSRLGRPVRLLVSDIDHARVVAAGRRWPGGDEVASHVMPVPWIHNQALTTLMKRSHFGLLHDWFPEPFGLYPLESVFQGNPIYTNGAGNLRHLLPPEHGIRVMEPTVPAGATGDPAGDPAGDPLDRYAAIAAAIADGLVSGREAGQCARGRDFIGQHYTADIFRRGLGSVLERIEQGTEAPPFDPATLVVELSPMVREIHREAGVVYSDVGDLRLPHRQIDLMVRIAGTPLHQALGELAASELTDLRSLLAAGAISLGSGPS